jgi:hypothetical protein
MIWREFVRNWPWPDLKYYPDVSLEGLRKTTVTSATLVDVWAEI